MASKGSRTLRTFFRPEFKDRYEKLSKQGWQDLEKLWEASLPDQAREKLETAGRIYAMVGPPHERNAVPVNKAIAALNAWIKASGRLRLALGAPKTSAPALTKQQVIERFCDRAAVLKINKMSPLSFTHYVVETAIGTAQFAIAKGEHQQISAALEKDLWRAWVAYVASVASDLGIKLSAASSNKTNKESPFVKGIIYLQERLPKECRRFEGYDSVAKGVQAAFKFKLSPETLLAILAGWGAGMPEFGEYNFSTSEAIVKNFLRGKETHKKASPSSRPS